MKETEKAYLAGIVDGEGYIGIIKRRNDYFLTFSVDMTDTESLELLTEVTNGHIETVTRDNIPNRKVQHRVRLGGADTKAFLKDLLPYLRVKRCLGELAQDFPIGSGGPLSFEAKSHQAILFGIFRTLNKRGRPL